MRRLRENTMLNTEIGKTGEVIVEGHAIGRLDGFMFAPDAAEAGSEAKALQAAAQKALAGEIEARAEKLSNAPDDQFVLASDGTLRWTGDAVAKLVASDEVLRPRLRIVADDRLAGAAREAVQARLDLWLKTHVEKLLGALFELAKAEDVTGIARGIAFQLTEGLGVLERSKVANEVKELDQTARATLRKYGVRFGAYHIYVPALLKPAARAIASLLWAHKQDNVDLSALSGAQQLAGSGRTSFPVDKALDRDAYRVLGYRQCGERAVRVDILERLADLIRPALAWRENSPGEKPAGAFDGRGFVVTQAMTSLTGSAGEDFASILRALGYRMERRPAPPAPPQEAAKPEAEAASASASDAGINDAVAPEAAATEPSSEQPAAQADAPADAIGASEADVGVATSDAVADEALVQAASTEPALPDNASATDVVAQAEAVSECLTAADVQVPEPETVSAEASADEAAEPAPSDPAEPAMIEVWRPGGRSDDRRPRHDRQRHRHHGQPRQQDAQTPAADGAAEGEGARERSGPRRRDRKDFSKFKRPEGGEARAEGAPSPERGEGRDRGSRERFEGRDKKFKRPHKGGRDNRTDKGGPALRPYASSGPRERERVADPNSPFAKLAALKEQLAATRKD
jgi:ATP-dependent RNA helicase SUPV3L1/SUV3